MDSFNGKCAQCKSPWKVVHVGTCQCGKIEQWKSILHPPLHGYRHKKSIPRGKPCSWRFFQKIDLGNCKKNTSLIAATLADAWQELQEPGTILAINGRADREQEPCWRKPGKTWHNRTDLAKTWNPAERSGTRRSGGTQTQRDPAEPGRGTRQRNPEGTGKRNRAEPGGKKISWRGVVGSIQGGAP